MKLWKGNLALLTYWCFAIFEKMYTIGMYCQICPSKVVDYDMVDNQQFYTRDVFV